VDHSVSRVRLNLGPSHDFGACVPQRGTATVIEHIICDVLCVADIKALPPHAFTISSLFAVGRRVVSVRYAAVVGSGGVDRLLLHKLFSYLDRAAAAAAAANCSSSTTQ